MIRVYIMRHTRGTTLAVAAAAGLCVVHDRMRHNRSNDARAPCASARPSSSYTRDAVSPDVAVVGMVPTQVDIVSKRCGAEARSNTVVHYPLYNTVITIIHTTYDIKVYEYHAPMGMRSSRGFAADFSNI